ncbi:MAG: hypothetical protein M0C28_34185 [Candidatus Moduliflexus flocculans]|nr:hypothetical protein [Candidatus Moduliflexus flocculans]
MFSEPFLQLALWIPAALMPLTFGLRLVTRDTYDALHYAMSVNWFVGAFLFGWGAVHHRQPQSGDISRHRPAGLRVYGAGRVLRADWRQPAWHAFGLALLAPIYILQRLEALRPQGRPRPRLPRSGRPRAGAPC